MQIPLYLCVVYDCQTYVTIIDQNNNSLYLKETAYIFTVDKGNAVEYS